MNRCIPLILLLLMIVSQLSLNAQSKKAANYVKCYTVEQTEQLRNQHPNSQTKEAFENWMAQKLQERKDNPSTERRATYTIPYIVHVVHGGQPLGTGPNITSAFVNAQIQQINDDFRRENSDASETPVEFDSVAAAFDVEFVPAVIDPNGNILDEPGINRVDGSVEFGVSGTWTPATIDDILKPGTIWDRNLYMNIWSADISGGILGYAQFPEMSTLPGVPGGGTEVTDGVVCAYGTLGSLDLPGPAGQYGLGRTLTHEIGHWAGLRHIWGDGDGTDYCDDTPCAGSSNFTGEPCTFPGANSCTDAVGVDLPDMFQNYMDYSDDACFNLFTADQVGRMEVVFANSPGRNDLLTSTVWQFPTADTIIAKIDQDVTKGCAPVVVNFSDDSFEGDSAIAIDSWEWNFDVDGIGGATPATFTGQTPPAVTFTNEGTYTISLNIDNGVYTGEATTTVVVESAIPLDVTMGFEMGIPATWTNELWGTSPTVGNNSSASIFQENYNNSGRVSAYISTPSIDMDVSATVIELTFDVAHAYYGSGFGEEEGLGIEVSLDCGETWNEIWRRLNSDDDPFYTTESTDVWQPAADEWRTEEIDLTAYKGNNNVRVRFHGISDWGNDTYLDNINISGITLDSAFVEAEFSADVTQGCPGLAVNFTDMSITGAESILSWEWNFDLNGLGGASLATFSGETPPTVSFSNSGTYTVQLIADNGTVSDTFTADIIVESILSSPVIMGFEAGLPVDWPNVDGLWQLGEVGYQSSQSMFQDNVNNEESIPAYINTPAIDLSGEATEAILTFDVAHAYYGGGFGEEEGLAIEVSTDCGATWTEIWRRLDSDADPFYTTQSTLFGWQPAEDEWRNETVDLSDYIGNPAVKVRFHGISDYGNDTYIDNINIILLDPNLIIASFTASALGGCEGQAIDFEDNSTLGENITSPTYEWNFDVTGIGGADPLTATGEIPPTVTFSQGGEYEVSLTVSQGTYSNTTSQTISIELPKDLTYTEDFSSSIFPTDGWLNDGFLQSVVSSDPLVGSLFADNWNEIDLIATASTPSLDFSWYDQVVLNFDVSHRRFGENEGLIVNTSVDCGLNWDEVWSKYDTDAEPLYTVEDETFGPFVPADASEWREETVDLSTLNDNSNVKLQFLSDGAFGNNTYIDDVNVEGWLFNPTDLTTTLVGSNNIELAWTDNSGKETAYEVLRWNENLNDFVVIATLGADANSYTDAGLSGPAEYTYQVCAYNSRARACSNTATDFTEAVLEVGGLIAVVSDQSGTSIELHWDDLSTTEDGFLIKRSEDDFATYEVINVLTPDQNYYLDEFLEETTTYTYQVCAFNSIDTVESNTDDATTELNAPSSLSATAVDNNVALRWTDNSSAEEGFQIKRSLTTGGPYATIATVGANVTAYTDFDLLASTEYCYVVCAFNAIAVACSDEECETTGFLTSVSQELSNAIQLYPNPANVYFELQLTSIKGDVQVKIYNQIGATIASETLNGGSIKRFEVKDYAAGVYMIRIETEEGFTTKKLVVE